MVNIELDGKKKDLLTYVRHTTFIFKVISTLQNYPLNLKNNQIKIMMDRQKYETTNLMVNILFI